MSIPSVITEGFGNGTFAGTIALVVTEGYTPGESGVVFATSSVALEGTNVATIYLSGVNHDDEPETVANVSGINLQGSH